MTGVSYATIFEEVRHIICLSSSCSPTSSRVDVIVSGRCMSSTDAANGLTTLFVFSQCQTVAHLNAPRVCLLCNGPPDFEKLHAVSILQYENVLTGGDLVALEAKYFFKALYNQTRSAERNSSVPEAESNAAVHSIVFAR